MIFLETNSSAACIYTRLNVLVPSINASYFEMSSWLCLIDFLPSFSPSDAGEGKIFAIPCQAV